MTIKNPAKLLRSIYSYRKFYTVIRLVDIVKIITSKKGSYTKVKLKNNAEVLFRNGNVNALKVAGYVFLKKFHIPPFPLPDNPIIVDLGSNIGFTVIDYKLTYSNAKILGVEMDPVNYQLCIQNTSAYQDVTVLNKGIWYENGEIQYNPSVNYDSYSATSVTENKGTNVQVNKIESITISALLATNNIKKVDFMKIDIEGAEIEIFKRGELDWLKLVDSLHLEIHDPKEVTPIIAILKNNNFEVTYIKHWSGALFAKKMIPFKLAS